MSPLADALARLARRDDLDEPRAHAAVSEIMDGTASDAAIAAFLTALRVKGETAEELAGAVRAVRERMTAWPAGDGPGSSPVVDTCGTGGDGSHTVNVSTAAALVVAACGVRVAKHGNRASSGNSGSAEVLAELGVAVDVEPDVARRNLDTLGITFLLAPRYHAALRFAGPARKQLPFRTLFNLVGPLANPARPDCQLIGVSGEAAADLMASASVRLGIRRAAVVTGGDGLDEVTLDGETRVRWVEGGRVETFTLEPSTFGLPPVSALDLRVSGPVESASLIRSMLLGEPGPVRSIVLANAAMALRVSGLPGTLEECVERAAESIDNGDAARLLARWAASAAPQPAA